jgi:nucleotide-binding universal stress UspA family protein
MNSPRIVVGYDGSLEAREAVDWAAAEAARTATPLEIAYAYQLTWQAAQYNGAVAQLITEATGNAERVMTEILDHVRRTRPGITVTGTAVHGAPAPALLDLARDAGLVVVGNRGGGGLTNLLLGSVSQQVATHAATPVAVVRGRSHAADGPVVVGLDGSAATGTALAAAFDAAAARGTEVIAIRAYTPPSPMAVPPSAVEAHEREALEASLRGWRDKYPAVKVEALLAAGRAARVLTGVSHTAQLVVVGSRGHGGFTGLLLGSVGLHLMHHAECPVLIVHPRKTA